MRAEAPQAEEPPGLLGVASPSSAAPVPIRRVQEAAQKPLGRRVRRLHCGIVSVGIVLVGIGLATGLSLLKVVSSPVVISQQGGYERLKMLVFIWGCGMACERADQCRSLRTLPGGTSGEEGAAPIFPFTSWEGIPESADSKGSARELPVK